MNKILAVLIILIIFGCSEEPDQKQELVDDLLSELTEDGVFIELMKTNNDLIKNVMLTTPEERKSARGDCAGFSGNMCEEYKKCIDLSEDGRKWFELHCKRIELVSKLEQKYPLFNKLSPDERAKLYMQSGLTLSSEEAFDLQNHKH